MSSMTPSDLSLVDGLDPATISTLQSNLSDVMSNIPDTVRLTPVSKTKPPCMLLPLIHHPDTPVTVFGENYVQECCDKMGLIGDQEGSLLPPGTKFAFIGNLQSNKVNMLVSAGKGGKLDRVETVSSVKLASKLDGAIDSRWSPGESLDVMIQIDTSGEATKGGLPHGDWPAVREVADAILSKGRLRLAGVMTIGAPGDMDCFDRLVEVKARIEEYLRTERGMEDANLRLSMGMSGDYKEAIERGSTDVRVGSTIFGARDYSNKN